MQAQSEPVPPAGLGVCPGAPGGECPEMAARGLRGTWSRTAPTLHASAPGALVAAEVSLPLSPQTRGSWAGHVCALTQVPSHTHRPARPPSFLLHGPLGELPLIPTTPGFPWTRSLSLLTASGSRRGTRLSSSAFTHWSRSAEHPGRRSVPSAGSVPESHGPALCLSCPAARRRHSLAAPWDSGFPLDSLPGSPTT